MNNFGQRIKQTRSELNLSQQGLAESFYKLDFKKRISRTSIAQWESGVTREIEADNLFRVAYILRVNPAWLLYGNDDNWYVSNQKIINHNELGYSNLWPGISTKNFNFY
jgi:transcriptional regulator with XRE-family HTH domain